MSARAVYAFLAAICIAGPAHAAVIVSFQEGVGGYTGNTANRIRGGTSGDSVATNTIGADGRTGNNRRNALVVFNSIFGPGVGQIPLDPVKYQIINATLTLVRSEGSNADDPISVHRNLTAFDPATVTFNNYFANPDPEYVLTPDSSIIGSAFNSTNTWNVTASLTAWLNGAANRGFFLATTETFTLGWAAPNDATPANRPKLTVTYDVVPEPVSLAWLGAGGLALLRRRRA